MKRTRRYIFKSLTVVSLLLMLGVVGLWVWPVENLSTELTEQVWLWAFDNDIRVQWHELWTVSRSRAFPTGSRVSFLGFEFQTSVANSSVVQVFIQVPYWLLSLVLAILPTIGLIKYRNRRKLGPNACPACGYDLTGNESGVCPECGAGAKNSP